MMRHEMIISYEIVDGMKTDMKNEGELVRCGSCRFAYTDKQFGGLYCKGKRVSPLSYCSWGMRHEERSVAAGNS